MSWVGVMVGVGVGAAAGGGMSALNGGSTEDILKGALIGGATGAVTGGAGSALGGTAGGAAGGGTGGAAGGGAGGTGGALASTTAEQLAQQGVTQTAEQGINAAAANAIPSTFGSGLGTGGTEVIGSSVGGNLGASGNIALGNSLTAGSVNAGGSGAVGGAAGGGAAPTSFIPQEGLGGAVDTGISPNAAAGYKPPVESTWGQRLANTMGADLGTVGNKVAGGAIENSVYGAGIGGLSAAAQGKDIGKGMLTGGAAGGFGGAVGAELGQAGGAVGQFASAHPTITAGGISALAAPVMESTFQPSEQSADTSSPFNTKWRMSKDYKPYISRNGAFPYAQGGITDLDAYDQTPQPQQMGTLDIPNRNEVANNQGYVNDSVQMMAHGGISDLGGYSDGGRLLKGPGDGVSDDIPASIAGKQPARLAEGEFVVPARIVSELGNGSTDAGAKRLYQMMERIQSDRKKTTGKGKFSDNPKAYKHLPAQETDMAAAKAATPYAYKYAAPDSRSYKATGAVPTKDQAKQGLIDQQKGIISSQNIYLKSGTPAQKAAAQGKIDAANKQIDTYTSKDFVMSNTDYMNSPQMQIFTSNPNNVKFLNNSTDPSAVSFRADQLKAQYGGVLGADGKPAFDDKYFTGLASGKYDPKAFSADLTKIATAEMANPNYGTDYTKVAGGTTGKVYQADLAKLAGDPAALIKAQAANKATIDASKKLPGTKTPEQIAADKAAAEYKANYKPFTVEKDTGYTKMYGDTPNKRLTQSGVETDANLALDRGIASLAKANMPPAAPATGGASGTAPVLNNVSRVAPGTTGLPTTTPGLISAPTAPVGYVPPKLQSTALNTAPVGSLPLTTPGIIGLPPKPVVPPVTPTKMKKGGIATLPATNKFVAKTHKVPVTGIANALKSKMGKK